MGRARWEEPKYFYNLEKKNFSSNTIKHLKQENCTYTTSNKKMLHEQYTFYRKLYQNDRIPEERIVNYLNAVINLTILSKEEPQLLEGEISDQECCVAIKNMKMNQLPGSDGIPVEFYLTCWTDIKDLLLDFMNIAYQTGDLSASQKRGILNLIFKKNDKILLRNWRPITLLNTDYKILAQILTNRFKKVIPKLIHTDQSGYIKGEIFSIISGLFKAW